MCGELESRSWRFLSLLEGTKVFSCCRQTWLYFFQATYLLQMTLSTSLLTHQCSICIAATWHHLKSPHTLLTVIQHETSHRWTTSAIFDASEFRYNKSPIPLSNHNITRNCIYLLLTSGYCIHDRLVIQHMFYDVCYLIGHCIIAS